VPAQPPKPMKLRKKEQGVAARIDFKAQVPSDATCDATRKLMESLLARDGIPAIRLRWFTDPALASLRGKSRMQNFMAHGLAVGEMFEHPHFVGYLRYFIYGPDLPAAVIGGFCKSVDEGGTSGMQMSRLCAFVRSAVRNRRVNKTYADDEFQKLALECELSVGVARSIRDAARSVR
jgi:hypothetical protein